SWWLWARRVLIGAFLALVAVLLVRYARRFDWPEVWHSLTHLPHRVVLGAIALAACSHLLYSCFDLIGRHYVKHRLATRRVMQIGAISYAFNLTMGSAVGGVGFRVRLYSGFGLGYAQIARVLTLSILTNWLGYLLLAGTVFLLAPLDLPPQWKLDGDELSLVGIALVAVALGYLGLCGWSRRRTWRIRGHEIFLPSLRLALIQLALSCCNWMLIAATIWTLLQGRVPYSTVLPVFLLAAMAGIVVRVPAGLGVVEAVFVTLLSHRIPAGQLLAALLGYRAIYYMLPLAVAALLYLRLELDARKSLRPHNVRTNVFKAPR
ncbi:MAG TPA: YbhN family protein, partial [Ramlibacter sp.]|uniref:lysylphosphatidylglycerol synthase transmembrane domain-containing protein n=1 Tax=Ramlibacter sp. TaxID=1917967 RepID=UPI002B8C38AA